MAVPKESQFAITLSEKCIMLNAITKKIPEGSLLKIKTMDEYGKFTFIDETAALTRKIFKSPQIYESASIEKILFLSLDTYMLAIAIENGKDRIRLCQSDEKLKFILQLNPSEPVKIPQGAFSINSGNFLRGFVKYKGTMDDVGPGYYFIVTILVILFYMRVLKVLKH